MKQIHHDDRGKFKSPNSTPLARKVMGVRLPIDMDATVRELAGDDLAAWIRCAIAEKLEREQQQDLSA
jgi:hypothetical protein